MLLRLLPSHQQGFTLVEVLVALGIFAFLISVASSSLRMNMTTNYRGQLRFEAAQAAQTIIDEIRYEDVSELPTSGLEDVREIHIDTTRSYEVHVEYCSDTTHCTSNDVRQIEVWVKHRGQTIYQTETIFTAMEKGYGGTVGGDDDSSGPTPTPTATPAPTPTPTITPTPPPTFTPTPSPTPRQRRRRCRWWRC